MGVVRDGRMGRDRCYEQMCIVTIRPLVWAALCSARFVTGQQAFPPRAIHSRDGDQRGMHVYVRDGRCGRLLPPRFPACSQLGQAARVCAASQFGGAICIYGLEDSTLTMSITNVVITGCSVEGGGDSAVRSRHVA